MNATWSGRDCKFVWRRASNSGSSEFGSEPFGANSGAPDPALDYLVQIFRTDGKLLRTEYVKETAYIYSYERNFEDRGGVPARDFTIKVWARNAYVLSALPAQLPVSNPQSLPPTAVTLAGSFKSIFLQIVPPIDPDWAGTLVFMSTVPGFVPSGTEAGQGNCVYSGADKLIVIGAASGTTYYLQYASFDVFGRDNLILSGEVSVATGFVVGTDIGVATIQTVNIALDAITAALIAANAVGTTEIADNSISTPKLIANSVTAGKIAAHSITANEIAAATITASEIAAATITAALIAAGTITAAQIAAGTITADRLLVSILSAITADLGDITAGSIRGVNVNASSHTTKGSYLTSAPGGGAATLNVRSTADFPASGSGVIVDITNDRDAFTYTGKTANTLTGCSGVLAHNNGATVIPLGKGILIDAATNEARFYGDRGDGVIAELTSIGINTVGSDTFIGVFGQTNAGTSRWGLLGASDTGKGVRGVSGSTDGVSGASDGGIGVHGTSTAGNGGDFAGNSSKGNMNLPSIGSFPSSVAANQLAQVSNRLYYSDGSHWLPLTQPYFESSEITMPAANVAINAAHGLTDGAGSARVPQLWRAVARCKTSEFGYSVGTEIDLSGVHDGDGSRAFTSWADSTNIGYQSDQGASGSIVVANRISGGASTLTVANWKIVFYAW